MPESNEYGAKIKSMREARGVSQAELARRVGHKQPWVSTRERGVTRVQAQDMREISKALGYVGGVVVSSRERGGLLELAERAEPEDVALVAAMLALLPTLKPQARQLLRAMVNGAIEAATQTQAL